MCGDKKKELGVTPGIAKCAEKKSARQGDAA
jgi:hypothetical protein